MSALRACIDDTSAAGDLGKLIQDALEALELHFGMRHSMVLMLDGPGNRLYTVASHGYPTSGIGSEIAVGCGVIAVAAAQRAPIRITHMAAEYSYGRAIRESMEREGLEGGLETAIPFPGLADSLLGGLYVEAPRRCVSATTTRMPSWCWRPN